VFDSIGWGEIVVLGLAALFIFGPERLPSLAKDAATGLKKLREAITGVRGQLHETLGDDFDHLRDMDLRQYNPKTFIRDQLLADDDTPVRRGSATGSTGVAASTAAGRVRPSQMTRPRDAATPPPFDPDAT
jgi:sec-independent protein translocase protein TatB